MRPQSDNWLKRLKSPFTLEAVFKKLKNCPHDFLKKREVTEILGFSERTFYRKIKSAELEATKVGGTWRVPKLGILAFLKKLGLKIPSTWEASLK